jgi:Uma2 family endonuclease
MTPYEFALWADANAKVRLEMVGGLPIWEAFPAVRHQGHSFRIQSSIKRVQSTDGGCTCVHYADIYVRFPDGSLKRPDIAIFCREPDEQDTAVTMLPEAVVEIISPDYEAKDLAVGVPFYLRMGVKDILVFDPTTDYVRHFRPGHSEVQHTSPTTLTLECGCEITI